MSQTGELAYGDVRAGDAAFCIHSEIYKSRDNINSIAHAHQCMARHSHFR